MRNRPVHESMENKRLFTFDECRRSVDPFIKVKQTPIDSTSKFNSARFHCAFKMSSFERICTLLLCLSLHVAVNSAFDSYKYAKYCKCNTSDDSSTTADAADWIASITVHDDVRTFESKLGASEDICSVHFDLDKSTITNPPLPFCLDRLAEELKTHSLRHACSAVILNDLWLLTAADCVASHSLRSIRVSYGKRDLYSLFRLGSHQIDQIVLSSHPDDTTALALLRLNQPINWNDNVRPACFAPLGNPHETYDVSKNGFHGYSWTTAIRKFHYRSQLWEVQTRMLEATPVEDESFYKMACLSDIDHMQCTQLKSTEHISCYHNRGSPLVQTRNGVLTLSAITLFAEGSNLPTKGENPSILCSGSDFHARVLSLMPWIQSHIGNRKCEADLGL
jgi:hypothetical protein